jgi:hypothetical protein
MTSRKLKDTRSGSHKNAAGEVLFVMLTAADGREVGAVRAEDEVFVKIAVRIDVADDITVRFVLHVNAHGTLAFRARSEFFAVTATGVHVTTIRIPPNLLAETIYSVSVDVVIVRSGTKKFPLAVFNALSFQVFDPSSVRRDTLGGMVSPKLDWTFNPQPQVTVAQTR